METKQWETVSCSHSGAVRKKRVSFQFHICHQPVPYKVLLPAVSLSATKIVDISAHLACIFTSSYIGTYIHNTRYRQHDPVLLSGIAAAAQYRPFSESPRGRWLFFGRRSANCFH